MLPSHIKPMLLEAVNEPFNSTDYIYEWKVDGVRCIMFYDHGKTRLQSKTGKDCTKAFPELHTSSVNAVECILDGEITVLTKGKPDFEATMGRYLTGPRAAITLSKRKPAYYIVWDILWLDERNLTGLRLSERKDILDRVLENSPHITKIDWLETNGLALWEAIKSQRLEGMVAKKKDSRYLPGKRSSAWLKIKNYQEAIVNVLGYKQKDGYVLVGTGDKVQGHAIGMGKTDRAALWEILTRYGTIQGDTTWLPVGIRGKVRFTTWTPTGKMRDCNWVQFEI